MDVKAWHTLPSDYLMDMMICMTNDGSYMTNGTRMCESSQRFGGKDHFMAAAKAYVAPVAAMILG